MKPPILRQRFGWQYIKLTVYPLAAGLAAMYAMDWLLTVLNYDYWAHAGLRAIGHALGIEGY